MTIYHGGNKIKSDNEFGVFYGNRAIKKIYKGSTLVYEVGTIFEATSGSKTVTLPEGNYYLILVGGGGGAGQVTGNVSEGGPGGSGACVKLKVHLMPGTYTLNGAAAGITGYDGTAGGTASIILNGTTLASAGGGGRPQFAFSGRRSSAVSPHRMSRTDSRRRWGAGSWTLVVPGYSLLR